MMRYVIYRFYEYTQNYMRLLIDVHRDFRVFFRLHFFFFVNPLQHNTPHLWVNLVLCWQNEWTVMVSNVDCMFRYSQIQLIGPKTLDHVVPKTLMIFNESSNSFFVKLNENIKIPSQIPRARRKPRQMIVTKSGQNGTNSWFSWNIRLALEPTEIAERKCMKLNA